MPFQKIAPPKKKSLQVAEQLLDQIRAGNFLAGSRLPSERELVERLGISRTVVREALSALQLSGIVESHVGDGTYVAKTVSHRYVSLSPILEDLTASVSIVEALQAREALDISVAHLAIENIKPEDIADLDRLVDEMRKAINKEEFRRYINLTLDFHIAVAKAASNAILEEAVVYLIGVIRPHLRIIEKNYTRSVAEQSFAVHTGILEGIRARNIETVIDFVRKHYREYPSLHR